MRVIKVGTLWITYQCAKEYGIKDGPQCRDFPYRYFKVSAHEAQIETIQMPERSGVSPRLHHLSKYFNFKQDPEFTLNLKCFHGP
jgi:hypothetical protein